MDQKASCAETQAGLPEIDRIAQLVRNVDAEEAFAKSGPPRRTFRQGEIQPAFSGEKADASGKKRWTELAQRIVQRSTGAVIEKRIGDPRRCGQEGNGNRKRHDDDGQVNDSSDDSNPEPCCA